MAPPRNVREIIQTLNGCQYDAFIVGGCVRDFLMGKTPKDWDIATSATPPQVKSLFARTFDTGAAHGTITVLLRGMGCEVTTFRIDGAYTDSRRPDSVRFTSDLEADLARRDFTMNAIAYHETQGFVDPFGGMADIRARLIRGVGEPSARFGEDALRMMRAVRFSAQLGFDIEAETYKALAAQAALLAKISVERVRDEWVKTLLADNPQQMRLLTKTALLSSVHAETAAFLQSRWDAVLPRVMHAERDLLSRLSLLFMDFETAQMQNTLKFFKFDNHTVKEVSALVRLMNTAIADDDYAVRHIVREYGHKRLARALVLKSIAADENEVAKTAVAKVSARRTRIEANGDCCHLADLAINGGKLKQLGIPPGKVMGETLNALLEAVLRDPSKNEAATLEALAVTCLPT